MCMHTWVFQQLVHEEILSYMATKLEEVINSHLIKSNLLCII